MTQPNVLDFNPTDELDSYMYQTVGHQVIELFAEAMDLPLYRRTIQGSSLETGRNYCKTEGDEVEDLYELLHLVKVGISSPHYLLLSWQCEWMTIGSQLRSSDQKVFRNLFIFTINSTPKWCKVYLSFYTQITNFICTLRRNKSTLAFAFIFWFFSMYQHFHYSY